MELELICKKAEEVVRAAGSYILEHRKIFSFDEIEKKGDRDFVTAIDKATERILTAGLKDLLPEAGFITEEATIEQGTGRLNWVIDPIDGTTNFIHNTPVTAVSVALMSDKEPLIGLVYEVTMNELFYTWKGAPAYLNGREIWVSSCTDFRKALVSTGFPYTRDNRLSGILNSAGYFLEHAQDLRRFGSAATDLCYVACGRVEIYYEAYLKLWDIAAGLLIVENAGGTIDVLHEHEQYGGSAVLATNGHVRQQAMEGVFFKDGFS